MWEFFSNGMIAVLSSLIAALIAGVISIVEYRSATAKQQILVSLQSEESSVAKELDEESKTDFGSLWAVTQKRIDYYHNIATTQARRSFISSQFATIAGFILIVVFGIISAQAPSTAGAISAGAVGVIGGGLSAYIGATFMKSQSEASIQLREFFLQPVAFSRLLEAERLIDSLEPSERSVAIQNIVQSIVLTPRGPTLNED